MKLTRRGKLVRTILIIIAAYLFWQVSTKLWWTGDSYCWGTYIECFLTD